MNSSKIKIIMAVGTGILSLCEIAYLYCNKDKLLKRRYCKSHEKNNAETKRNEETVTEDIREVRVRIPQEKLRGNIESMELA